MGDQALPKTHRTCSTEESFHSGRDTLHVCVYIYIHTYKYLFFSSTQRTLTKLDNISVHKKVSVNFKRLRSFKVLSPNIIEKKKKHKKSITGVKLENLQI